MAGTEKTIGLKGGIWHGGQQPPSALQMGDLLESFLSSVGVTKERYVQVKADLGLEPTCNCADRQEWLNKLGEKTGINNLIGKFGEWRNREQPPAPDSTARHGYTPPHER